MAGNLLHLFVLFAYCSCDIDVTQMIEISDMKNLRLGAGGKIALTKSSALHCAVNCISNSSCVALSYRADERSCLVYDFVVSSCSAGIVSGNGWISYRKINARCPVDRGYTYSPALDWCYKLFTDKDRNALSATNFCNQDCARLLQIDSEEKQLHMTDFLISHEVPSIWLAGRSENRDGTFRYEDGTVLSYFNWSPGQPRPLTSISMELQGNGFVWSCGHGTLRRDFMCEI